MERTRIHPVVLAAAASVLLVSLLGAAALTGMLPTATPRQDEAAAPAKSAPAQQQPAPGTARGQAASCANCGVIVSIRAVEVKGEASGIGVVAGGVTGAVVGNQIGRGDTRTLMAVAGAAGGALAGNEIEKHVRKRTVYRVVVRLDDGTTRTVSQPSAPAFAVGERVRVQGNALERS